MYKICNDEMLKFFQANSESRFLYTCIDIAKAGEENHIVKKIEFYTSEKNKLEFGYVEFNENIDNELTVYINTTFDDLIEMTCKKILETYDLYETVGISTSNIDLAKNDIILKYFNVTDIAISEHGVYALLSNEKLLPLNIPNNVEISLASFEQIEAIKNLDNDKWHRLPSFLQSPYIQQHIQKSELLFLLEYNNDLAGYLQANCRYKNFYDVAYVFVHEDFRGKGFGHLLTMYFAHYCLDNGLIPHYGYAESKYSADIAVKSGFEESERRHFFTISAKET